MKPNETSKAVSIWLQRAGDDKYGIIRCEQRYIRAITEKYQRMEKTLKESQSAICSEYCGSGSHVGYCLDATEALAFDPLK